MPLVTTPNATAPDDIYEAIIRLHDGLSEEASAAANARLIIILANHIGDAEVLRAAAALARDGLAEGRP
jgi:predicted LPLAT superfamily acyltransferase